MSKFKQFINEVSTAQATQMEEVIVDLWNGNKPKHDNLAKTGKSVVEFLRSQGLKKNLKAVHLGSGASAISKDWIEWGGTDGTPKTDFMIGKYRISLKKAGGSQLMSAKKGEATATCYAAIKKAKLQSSHIVDEMEVYLNKFIEGKNKLNVSQQKKTGKVSKDIINAEKMHTKFTAYLKDLLEENTKFRDALIHEAMTGQVKFGDKSEARADRILVFDPDGNHTLNDCDNKSFIAQKASHSKPSISWKSVSSTTKKAGKVYSYFSAFRLTEEIERRIQEEIDKYNGEVLTEGILSTITDKVKGWFNNVWTRIKQWLSQSFFNVLQFFGLVPEVEFGPVKF